MAHAEYPVDMKKVSEQIRKYDEEDSKIIKVEPQLTLRDTLMRMMRLLRERRGYDASKCDFWMNRKIFSQCLYNSRTNSPSQYRGSTIRTDTTMPIEFILYMEPDAVSLTGTVLHPPSISYTELKFADFVEDEVLEQW